jgi:hypothetical protein
MAWSPPDDHKLGKLPKNPDEENPVYQIVTRNQLSAKKSNTPKLGFY